MTEKLETSIQTSSNNALAHFKFQLNIPWSLLEKIRNSRKRKRGKHKYLRFFEELNFSRSHELFESFFCSPFWLLTWKTLLKIAKTGVQNKKLWNCRKINSPSRLQLWKCLNWTRYVNHIFPTHVFDFSPTHSSNCTDGYLKIYLKGQETMDAYDKYDHEFCGTEKPYPVVSEGPRLVMVFSSGELQGRGFKVWKEFSSNEIQINSNYKMKFQAWKPSIQLFALFCFPGKIFLRNGV